MRYNVFSVHTITQDLLEDELNIANLQNKYVITKLHGYQAFVCAHAKRYEKYILPISQRLTKCSYFLEIIAVNVQVQN